MCNTAPDNQPQPAPQIVGVAVLEELLLPNGFQHQLIDHLVQMQADAIRESLIRRCMKHEWFVYRAVEIVLLRGLALSFKDREAVEFEDLAEVGEDVRSLASTFGHGLSNQELKLLLSRFNEEVTPEAYPGLFVD